MPCHLFLSSSSGKSTSNQHPSTSGHTGISGHHMDLRELDQGYFTAGLAQSRSCANSLPVWAWPKTYLSGVRQHQIAHRGKDPRCLASNKSFDEWKQNVGREESLLVLTPVILQKMKRSWIGKDSSFDSIMVSHNFLIFLSFRGITVVKEDKYDPTTYLSFSDVAADSATSPSVISLNIKYSRKSGLPSSPNDDLCPVTALLKYFARQGSFPGALFQWQDKMPLSKHRFVE